MISENEKSALDFKREFPEIVNMEKLENYLSDICINEFMRGYSDGYLDYPAEQLGKKYGETISISELNKRYAEKYKSKYCLAIWYNDMIGWGCSYAAGFTPNNCRTIDQLTTQFDLWVEQSGDKLFAKFALVPYPHDASDDDALDTYFTENYKIVEELEKSIEEFTGNKDEI